MSGHPLDDAKRGCNAFLTKMEYNDRVSLISFADTVELEQEATQNYNSLFIVVNDIRPGRSTALYDGIARAALTLVHKKATELLFI